VTTLLVFYCAAGVLLLVLSIPLLLKKIPPNPIYGFRVSQTLENPEIWYAVNQYAARWLALSGASIAIAAVGLYFFPSITVDGYALACLAVFAVVFITGLVQSVRYLRSIT